jgi:hypothetical protein
MDKDSWICFKKNVLLKNLKVCLQQCMNSLYSNLKINYFIVAAPIWHNTCDARKEWTEVIPLFLHITSPYPWRKNYQKIWSHYLATTLSTSIKNGMTKKREESELLFNLANTKMFPNLTTTFKIRRDIFGDKCKMIRQTMVVVHAQQMTEVEKSSFYSSKFLIKNSHAPNSHSQKSYLYHCFETIIF